MQKVGLFIHLMWCFLSVCEDHLFIKMKGLAINCAYLLLQLKPPPAVLLLVLALLFRPIGGYFGEFDPITNVEPMRREVQQLSIISVIG